MAETTEYSWIRDPKLMHSQCPYNGKVCHYSSLKTIETINKKLTQQQKIMFQDSCFGQFLNLGLENHHLEFAGQLIHQLLVREIESPNADEMWFLLGERIIRFSMQEFCILTGLNCGPCAQIDVSNVEDGRLVDEFFDGDSNLIIGDLEAAFLKGSGNDETMVKLAMLYFLESVLLARRKSTPVHDFRYILLIDDFQQFQNYSWGRVCYEMTINSLKNAMPSCTYMLKGFPYAFQVWAFEAIPSLNPPFASKIGSQLPRICNWLTVGRPTAIKVDEIFKQDSLQAYTLLEPSDEEKQQDYLQPFISPACSEGSPTNSQELSSQVDRHLVEESKVGTNDGVKRKHKTEAALEESCSPQRKLKSRFGGSDSLSHEQNTVPCLDSNQQCTDTPPEASHSSLPAAVEINVIQSHAALPDVEINVVHSHAALPAPVDIIDVDSQSDIPASMETNDANEQANDLEMIQPSEFRLREERAFFERIKFLLQKSPQEFSTSSQSTAVPLEEINQAKRLLQPFYSMKFEQLANQSEQLESSIELLLEADHFPPRALDQVKSFHKNIASDIGRHSNNCARISKFDKNKEESEMHKEELRKLESQIGLIANKTTTETQKLKQISESISSKEAEVRHLAESAKASADPFTCNRLRLKKLEEEKQEAEKEMAKILNRWDEFKKVIGEYL